MMDKLQKVSRIVNCLKDRSSLHDVQQGRSLLFFVEAFFESWPLMDSLVIFVETLGHSVTLTLKRIETRTGIEIGRQKETLTVILTEGLSKRGDDLIVVYEVGILIHWIGFQNLIVIDLIVSI